MTTTTRVRDRLDPLRKLRRRVVDGAGAGEERGERPALRPRGPVERVARREELASRRHALPRREFRHEPDNTTCGCGQAMQRIGEDVAEKLDYQPGVFTVERHVRGKWVCR